jgi:hypothetical protein
VPANWTNSFSNVSHPEPLLAVTMQLPQRN